MTAQRRTGRAKQQGARRLLAALTLALAMLALGCGEDTDRMLGRASEPEVRIAVAEPESYRFFQPFVAEELGFLDDEKVSLRMIDAGDDAGALAAVRKGHADLAMVGAPAAIQSLAAGAKLRIVYESAPGGAVTIQVPCGSCTGYDSVRFSRLAELRGRTLGIAGGQAGKQFLALSLARAGLAADAIETKAIDSPDQAHQAFSDREIDAYLAPDELLDGRTESTYIVPMHVPSAVFVSGATALAGRRRLLGRGLRAWARATYTAILNPSVAAALPDISSRGNAHNAFDDAHPAGAGDETYEEDERYARARIEPAGSDVFGKLERTRLRTLAATMRDAGIIDRVPRLDTVLDDGLIATANRFDRRATWCRSRDWQQRNVKSSEKLKLCRPAARPG